MVLRHRFAAPFAAVLALTISTVACSSPDPTGADPPSETQRRLEPPAAEQPDPQQSEQAEPAPEYAPAEIAELVCEDVLYNAPPLPYAESGDPDDEMALVETMHADMLDDALDQIQPSPELEPLTAVMVEMSDLSRRAAVLYAGDVIVNEELQLIWERQEILRQEAESVASAVGAPACAELVIGL